MSGDKYIRRHNGPQKNDIAKMLEKIGVNSVQELIDQTVPVNIRLKNELNISKPLSEAKYQKRINDIISKNKIFDTFIGLGYYDTISPSVIMRNIFENPSWYTSYTPYQAEISQGRLEALLNFQTVVMELTGCDIANASLLDEATAAAEAMIMMANLRKTKEVTEGKNILFVDKNIFPQTKDVIITRAEPLDIIIEFGDFNEYKFTDKVFGTIIQYPNSEGKINDYQTFTEKAHKNGTLVAVAADLLSLTILTPPSHWEADIVFGSTQRFGVPMGFGGPHAAYFATRESYKRSMPGRIIGISKDVHGNTALRMALQTREQHIKREKATSNICTAQALLAIMAGMYAVYHGKKGLTEIALNIHFKASTLAKALVKLGYEQENYNFFDTLKVNLPKNLNSKHIRIIAKAHKVNFRYIDNKTIGISINETTSAENLNQIISIFAIANGSDAIKISKIENELTFDIKYKRENNFLEQDVFSKYHSETDMMRYIKKLERKDISLTQSMISLGSCTMKLNASALMMPLSNPKLGQIHPFVPKKQAAGYNILIDELKKDLLEITGFKGITFQPNSGAAGEYAGLMMIRAYHKDRKELHRNIALIPSSAHGTNPASAVMAGMKVVVIECDNDGNINIEDLKNKAEIYKENLSCFMITYPSTHGVFEPDVIQMCDIIHANGGLVYMDGANMNAQVGITNPGTIGADVCHLNLHKTFGIPHGGGGPGVGPVAVNKLLKPYLPHHFLNKKKSPKSISAVSGAPYGSASVLPITHGYIKMLGANGLKKATETAIVNANYMASSLNEYFKVLYTGKTGRVAHEMILDCRNFKQDSGISETDIAKRLMDYGFHAPTLSFPVHGTLMIEPTESESLYEIDKFIDTMKSIHSEIQEIIDGKADKEDNVLKNAPHSEKVLIADEWTHSYSRTKAAFPLDFIKDNKFQIPVGRIDDAYGDRNLVCSCTPISEYR
jgi:glycine dehydrogenase